MKKQKQDTTARTVVVKTHKRTIGGPKKTQTAAKTAKKPATLSVPLAEYLTPDPLAVAVPAKMPAAPVVGEALEQLALSAVSVAFSAVLMIANYALLKAVMVYLTADASLGATAALGIISAEAVAGIAHGEGGKAAMLGLLLLAVLCGLEVLVAIIRETAVMHHDLAAALDSVKQLGEFPTDKGLKALKQLNELADKVVAQQATLLGKRTELAQTRSCLETPAMAVASVALSIGTERLFARLRKSGVQRHREPAPCSGGPPLPRSLSAAAWA
jgi:hypothetical protein